MVRVPDTLRSRLRADRYIQNRFTLNRLDVVLMLKDGGDAASLELSIYLLSTDVPFQPVPG
jgi:hypothetical protein